MWLDCIYSRTRLAILFIREELKSKDLQFEVFVERVKHARRVKNCKRRGIKKNCIESGIAIGRYPACTEILR